jgi:hypothetical protein
MRPPGDGDGKLEHGMATPTDSSMPVPPDDHPRFAVDDSEPPRRSVAFAITMAAVTVLIGAWVYVLFFYDPGLMIDELADKTFPTQAEEVCAATVEQLSTLPMAQLATSADDRAETVAQSNVLLRDMVEQLRPLVPTSPPQVASGVDEWLDDWETYVGNREQYVENLTSDPEARFLESTKGTSTKGITRAINGFAEVNEMVSCTTPADLS